MSIFQLEQIDCPACGQPVSLDVSYSVNADQRPDLRAAILEGSFQQITCPHCASSFRLEPRLTYLDETRQQWIAARPAAALSDWAAAELRAAKTFDRSSPSLSPGVVPRVTFGWAALREKLLIGQHGLDDCIVELVKVGVIRNLDQVRFSATRMLRLVDVSDERLVLVWIDDLAGADEALTVPRAAYSDVAASPGSWAALAQELSSGLFVDARRLFLTRQAPAERS